MVEKKEVVAMLLAGGQGSRLEILTKNIAKPAVPYGGKYRIIDFPLSNCVNSGITNIGVLTQYKPLLLNSYIGNGQPWDLDRMNGGVAILPPYTSGKAGEWYKGTANAIYQNLNYIEQFDPEYVLILSGDHIYKMNYSEMIDFHKKKEADLTISTIEVDIKDASRFGILNTNKDYSVYEFVEKPKKPISNKASMGIYVFTYSKLKKYLEISENDKNTSFDFGKDIIPAMLKAEEKVFAFPYSGYWKDVGTIESLWEANMDLIDNASDFNLSDPLWRIYCRHIEYMPQYISSKAEVSNSMISEGCEIRGKVTDSILSSGVIVEDGAEVKRSVIMHNTIIKKGAKVYNSIIAEEAVIMPNVLIGTNKKEGNKINVIGRKEVVSNKANKENKTKK